MNTVKKHPMYRYLGVLTIGATVGLRVWLTLFNKFGVEVAGLEGKHIGVQKIRLPLNG